MWSRLAHAWRSNADPVLVFTATVLALAAPGEARAQGTPAEDLPGGAESPGEASPRPPVSSLESVFPGGFAPDTLEKLAAHATSAVVLINARAGATSRQGSGFLVDPRGRILTNNHVIRDARSVRVKLSSGDVYDRVTVLATDERRDIAVLQIPGFDLPALPLANSDSVRIGAPVVLIGSPLGLENTVSTGIVSGRRQEDEGFQLLQISAPASVGSSGGPVMSSDGSVIGIAASQLQNGQNLNFAVPINYARGLLEHLGPDPVAVLEPDGNGMPRPGRRLSTGVDAVNEGLAFEVDGFAGYSVQTEGRTGEDRWRRARVTYRRIETVGGVEPRIERYAESETTRQTGSFGTPQTVRRERSRTIVSADGLRPISARGEITWWTGQEWETSQYDLQFDGPRVRGVIRDTTGRAQELDRELPPGILLREVRDLAFATLDAPSLVGRSVEFVTFDPHTGEVTTDRYDVHGRVEVEVAGRSYDALRVNIASGLSNATGYFRVERPRVLLRLEGEGSGGREDVTSLEMFRETNADSDDSG